MRIKNTKETLRDIEDRMDNSDKVFFIRFGDNDISQMSGYSPWGRKLTGEEELGKNKTTFSVEQKTDLQKSFYINDKDYLIAVTGNWPIEEGMRKRLFGSVRLNQTLEDLERLRNKDVYLNPIVFHYLMAFRPERLKEFFDNYIKGKILFIGSMDNYEVFGDVDKIDTPSKNAYVNKKNTLKQAKEKIRENNYDVVILACGQLGRAIAHYLWNMEEKFHCIDIGSIVDVFDGKGTRRWIRKGKAINNLKYFTDGYNITDNNSEED